MSSEPTIRAALKTILDDIAGGNFVVHDYQRDSEAAFLVGDQMKGFYLTNADEEGGSVEIRSPLDVGGAVNVVRGWTITGFWEFDDTGASEKTFRGVLSDILDALTPHRSLNGGSITAKLPSILAFRFARFGNRRVHVGVIGLETRSEEHFTPPI